MSGAQRLDLIWRAVPGARLYEVEILDATGDPVFTATTADTSIAVPPSLLHPAAEYRWWVRAETADGAQRRSTLQPFQQPRP